MKRHSGHENQLSHFQPYESIQLLSSKIHAPSIQLITENGSTSKEIQHGNNRRTDHQKEEKGNQRLGNRKFVLLVFNLSKRHVAALVHVVIELGIALADATRKSLNDKREVKGH